MFSGSNPNIIDLSFNAFPKLLCPMSGRSDCHPCDKFIALETKILDTAEQLRAMLTQHKEMEANLNYHHSDIVRKMPTEIMSYIFQWCIADVSANGLDSASRKDVFMPFTLGSVCRSWRQIVWSSPYLWTHVSIKPISNPNTVDLVELVSEWLSRSKALPILVHVYASTDNDRVQTLHWKSTLEVLAQSSERWCEFHSHLPVSSLQYLCGQMGGTPLMQTLDFTRWADDNYFGTPVDVKLWKNHIPKPSKVYLDNEFYFEAVNINWSAATDVEVYFPIGDCLKVLKDAPLLDACDFTVLTRPWQSTLTWMHINHQNLKDLSVHTRRFCPELFSSITLPRLAMFQYQIRGVHRDPNQPNDLSLLPFFERSAFPLTHLSIQGTAFTYDYMRALLRAAPSITHLSLKQIFPLYALLQPDELEQVMPAALLIELSETSGVQPTTLDSSSSIILPYLQSLQFNVDFPFPWNRVPDVFGPPSDFNNPRRRPLYSFEVSIDYLPSRIDQDTTSRLRALREVGAQIRFKGFNGDPLVV